MSERPSSTAICVASGPDVHAHEVAADRPTLALAARGGARGLLVELDRRSSPTVGRDRLAAPRPAATARGRGPPRRRRRRAGRRRPWSRVVGIVRRARRRRHRVADLGLARTSARSATSGSWICPSIGRSGSSGSASSTSSSGAPRFAPSALDADGCGHRGCRGGASCERATLRRLTLRPLTLYRPTPWRATQQAAPASQARRRRSASVRTSGGSLLMTHAPSRAARRVAPERERLPSRAVALDPLVRAQGAHVLRRWATPQRGTARPGAEPAAGLPARRRT